MGTNVPWTKEAEQQLRQLWSRDGLSASEIARQMGLPSRDAVLGKAFRMGLKKRKETANPGPAKVLPAIPSDCRAERPNAWVALDGISPVSMADLDAGMCKWPIGEGKPYLFCGASTEGSYCEHHKSLSVGLGTISERQALHSLKAAA